jgi:O-antigen/teichoic acid export membrane protein
MKNEKKNIINIIVHLLILLKNNIIIAISSYFLFISLANHLGPEQYGYYSHILIISSLISILINFGTEQTAAIEFSKSNNINKVFNDIYRVRIIITIPIIFILLIFYNNSWLIFSCILCLIFQNYNLSFLYEIRASNSKYSYIFLTERLVFVLIALTLLYLNFLDLQILFALLCAVTMISIFYQFNDNSRYINFKLFLPFDIIKLNFEKNFPLVIIALSSYAYGGFSRIILESQIGSEQMGIFSAGWQLIVIGTIFQAQVSRIWRTRISEIFKSLDRKYFFNEIKTYFLLTTLPMVILSSIFTIFSEQIIKIIFTDSYWDLIDILPIIGVYLVVINLAGLIDMLWVATGKISNYMWISFLFGVLLIIYLLFVPLNLNIANFAIIIVSFHFMVTFLLSTLWIFKFNKLNNKVNF